VANALSQSNLAPDSYRFVAVGLDPTDRVSDARDMKRAQLGNSSALSATRFLTGDKAAVEQLAQTLGYRYVFDATTQQYAHPAAVFVLTPDGRVARVLSGLGLEPNDIKFALIDAANGNFGTWTDRVRLICYGYDPAQGIYTLAIHRVLMVAAAATVLT